MAIDTNLTLIFWNTLGGILSGLPYFFLIIWGVRVIAKQLKEGIKNIPLWLEQYDKIKMKHYNIEKAFTKRPLT